MTLHVVFAGVEVLLMVLFIAFGFGARGKGFRLYSIATIVAMLAFGGWVSTRVPRIAAGQPTPWMGIVEHVRVYSPLLWVLVLAIVLLRSVKQAAADNPEIIKPIVNG